MSVELPLVVSERAADVIARVEAAFDAELTATHDDLVLLSIPEVMKLLAVSKGTVRRLMADGRLPVIRVASAPRVSVADLRRYINSARVITTRSQPPT